MPINLHAQQVDRAGAPAEAGERDLFTVIPSRHGRKLMRRALGVQTVTPADTDGVVRVGFRRNAVVGHRSHPESGSNRVGEMRVRVARMRVRRVHGARRTRRVGRGVGRSRLRHRRVGHRRHGRVERGARVGRREGPVGVRRGRRDTGRVENVFNRLQVLTVRARESSSELWRGHSMFGRRSGGEVRRVGSGAREMGVRVRSMLGIPSLMRAVPVFARVGRVTLDRRGGSARRSGMDRAGGRGDRSGSRSVVEERHGADTSQNRAGRGELASGRVGRLVVARVVRFRRSGS